MSSHLRERRLDNPSSWQWTIAFFEDITSHPNEKFLPLLHLVQQLAASEYAPYFRAGQSVWSLVISTAARNGLRFDEPYVRVALLRLDIPDTWQVGYYRGALADDLLDSRSCSTESLLPIVTVFLQRLWQETRGEKLPVPAWFEGTNQQPKQPEDN